MWIELKKRRKRPSEPRNERDFNQEITHSSKLDPRLRFQLHVPPLDQRVHEEGGRVLSSFEFLGGEGRSGNDLRFRSDEKRFSLCRETGELRTID